MAFYVKWHTLDENKGYLSSFNIRRVYYMKSMMYVTDHLICNTTQCHLSHSGKADNYLGITEIFHTR